MPTQLPLTAICRRHFHQPPDFLAGWLSCVSVEDGARHAGLGLSTWLACLGDDYVVRCYS